MNEPGLSDLEKIALPTSAPLGGIYFHDQGRMHRRVTAAPEETGLYHVMSRTAAGQKVFGDADKEAFRVLMWRMAKFSGVEVLTYCVMDNHFHLLLRIPQKERFVARFNCDEPGGAGEERLLEHLRLLYSKAYLDTLRREISELREWGKEREVQSLLERYKRRFCDLSLFVKELKERFSRWFNKKYSRKGTLWMARFKSVMVENGGCLQTIAAYIDLNPVRAGLVARPEDYRWCGYSEALGGSKRMRRGLCRVIGWPIDNWELPGRRQGKRESSGGEAYREMLFEKGFEREGDNVPGKRRKRYGLRVEAVRKVVRSGGQLPESELVSHRVRWFSEGVALGSEDFLRRTLGSSFDAGAFKPVPVSTGESVPEWYSLSRLRGAGIG